MVGRQVQPIVLCIREIVASGFPSREFVRERAGENVTRGLPWNPSAARGAQFVIGKSDVHFVCGWTERMPS